MHHHYLQLAIIILLIAVLSLGAVFFFFETRDREMDLTRVLCLNKIQSALEVFYNDYGTYPEAIGHSRDSNGNTIPGLRFDRQKTLFPKMSTEDDVTMLSTLVYGGYLDSVPIDPFHEVGSNFVYAYYVADERTPTGSIPNQYYQLSSKLASQSHRETRAAEGFDGGNDKDENGNDLYEIGNAVGAILVSDREWEIMIARGDFTLDTARRIHTPTALARAQEGKKLDIPTLEGIYW
jgi:hypothetical protein